MNIFVVNSGSSSIKYQFFKMPAEQPVCSGLAERIGLENSVITHKIFVGGEEKIIKRTIDLADHEEGLKEVANLLTDAETGVIKNPDEIKAVGHRVVHGGETFAETTILTKKVKEKIKKLFPIDLKVQNKHFEIINNFHQGCLLTALKQRAQDWIKFKIIQLCVYRSRFRAHR